MFVAPLLLAVLAVPAPFVEFTNTTGFTNVVSCDRTGTNRAAAQTRHSPAKIGVGAPAAAVSSQRTNRHEELAELGPAIDYDGVAAAIIL